MYLPLIQNVSLVTLARFSVGIVLLVAAIGKWLDREQFARAVMGYQILPPLLARPIARAIPWIEFGLGLLLVFDQITPLAASLTIGLLVLLTAAQVVTLMRGQQVDCHCFGSLEQEKVGMYTLLRNAVLMLIALWILFSKVRGDPTVNSGLSMAEQATLFMVALGIFAMYLLAHQALKMLTQAKG